MLTLNMCTSCQFRIDVILLDFIEDVVNKCNDKNLFSLPDCRCSHYKF